MSKRRWDGPRLAFVFVFVSLLLAAVYTLVVLVLAPAHAQARYDRTKSDYVLMLLQCLLGLAALLLPNFLQKKHRFVIPSRMLIFYALFLYGAIFLGEVLAFYYRVPHWDTILHTLSGAMLGALGFSVLTVLNRTENIPLSMSPAFVAVFAFCFAVALGVVWEIYEYSVDALFHTNMQKYALEGGEALQGQAALRDTMEDLIVDALGALVMSAAGYLSLKRGTDFVQRLLLRRRGGPQR